MKVSKVGHMRTAVGKKSCEESVAGMVYKSPVPQKDIEIRSHLAAQNGNNQKMYSLFGCSFFYLEREFEDGLGREEFEFQKNLAKQICKQISSLEKVLLKNKKWDAPEININQLSNCRDKKEWEKTAKKIVEARVEQQLQILKDYKVYKKIYFQNKEKTQRVKAIDFVHKLVTFQLRKSFRKTVKGMEAGNEYTIYLPDIVEKLVMALCAGRNYNRRVSEIREYELCAFLTALNNDYLRLKQMKDIANSIEKKNVKVQIGAEKLLQLSNAGHPKKKVIFDFMKRYANAESTEQDRMLCHIQMLIVLFLEGAHAEDRLNLVQGRGIWLKNRYQWSANDVFDFLKESGGKEEEAKIEDLLQQKFSRDISAVDRKRLRRQIQETVRKIIAEHFREAKNELQKMQYGEGEKKAEDIFWLEFIERTVEKALVEKRLDFFKLRLSWLYQFIWRDWVSYLALKYIDMGKAVYHFAMPDLSNRKGKMRIKEAILPENRNEITSFDYELIKADETLERDLSLYVSFAVNRLGRAVAPESSYEKIDYKKDKHGRIKETDYTDLLFLNCGFSTKKEEVLEKKEKFTVYTDYQRRLLQYFGGQSQFKEIKEDEKYELINCMRDLFSYVRNSTFHYTGTIDLKEKYDNALVENIYKQELAQLNRFFRKKYYSNNVPAYYEEEHIKNLMESLYQSPKNTPAQIPSFNRVLPRKKLDVFLEALNIKKRGQQYEGCMYFLFKEIYYYDFIKQKNLKTMFINALNKRSVPYNTKEYWAKENFKKRINSFPNLSMGELAQIIMTDYNMQNQEKEVLANADKHKEEIYKHFPILLAEVLQDAFKFFLQEQMRIRGSIYAFLREPYRGNEKTDEEAFCSVPWRCEAFKLILDEKSKLCYAWYAVAHFLNPRYLNLLIGSIKNYIAYVNSIDRRARDSGNKFADSIRRTFNRKTGVLKQTLSVLEFVMALSGRVSHCFSDYFEETDELSAEEQYTKYLASFVDFQRTDEGIEDLQKFCSRKAENSPNPEGCIGLYYDEKNPILNRNIILARLYGDEKLMAASMSKVEVSEIEHYYKLMSELAGVFESGKCCSANEQKHLVEFQHLKNRIELHDVMKLSEITNDLVAQIISWAYLRERDLMYFQLGYHYIKLFYGCEEEDWKHKIESGEEGFSIEEGALLYQIVAVYTFSLPVYLKGKDGMWKTAQQTGTAPGSALKQFWKYCGGNYDVYTDGLHLFEEVDRQHDEMVQFRNHSDHFKYYAFHDMSILDMYHKIYSGFFSYDRKLQKSVSFIFPNILQRYSVIARIGRKRENSSDKFTLTLVSDDFTYKVEEKGQEKKIKVSVREEKFLQQLQRILEYKIISE